jgi:hypothetical protein
MGQILATVRSAANVPLGIYSSMEIRHSLFIGAEGWLALHLVQLVYFMLLQERFNKTTDVRVLEKHKA